VEPRPRPTTAVRAYLPDMLDRSVLALRREFGTDAVEGMCWDHERGRFLEWFSVCPIRPQTARTVRLQTPNGRLGSLHLACSHGCLSDDLREAIRELERRHERRYQEAVDRAVAA